MPQQSFPLTISFTLLAATLSPVTTTVPPGIKNTPYSQPIEVAGGELPIVWSPVHLPPGLSLVPEPELGNGESRTAMLVGTPVGVPGSDSIQIVVGDSGS